MTEAHVLGYCNFCHKEIFSINRYKMIEGKIYHMKCYNQIVKNFRDKGIK